MLLDIKRICNKKSLSVVFYKIFNMEGGIYNAINQWNFGDPLNEIVQNILQTPRYNFTYNYDDKLLSPAAHQPDEQPNLTSHHQIPQTQSNAPSTSLAPQTQSNVPSTSSATSTVKRLNQYGNGNYGKRIRMIEENEMIKNPAYSDISSDSESEEDEPIPEVEPNVTTSNISNENESENEENLNKEKFPKLIIKLPSPPKVVEYESDEHDLPEICITKEEKEKRQTIENKIITNRMKIRQSLDSEVNGILKNNLPVSDTKIVMLEKKYGRWIINRRFIYALLISLCKCSFHIFFDIVQKIPLFEYFITDVILREIKEFKDLENTSYVFHPIHDLYLTFVSEMEAICKLLLKIRKFEELLRQPANIKLESIKFDSNLDLINSAIENLYLISILDNTSEDIIDYNKKKNRDYSSKIERNILNEMINIFYNLPKLHDKTFPSSLINTIIGKKKIINETTIDKKSYSLSIFVNCPLKKEYEFTDDRIVRKYVNVKSYYF